METVIQSIFQDVLPETNNSQVKFENSVNDEESAASNQDLSKEYKEEFEIESENIGDNFLSQPEHNNIDNNTNENVLEFSKTEINKTEISESNQILIANLLNNKQADWNEVYDKEMLFQCPICIYKSKVKTHFKRHLNNHIALKTFECPECDYKAKRKDKLNNHIATHKGDIAKKFHCSLCSYKCIRKEHLTKHMQKHDTNKDYKCSECNKYFKTDVCLKVHMKLHNGEKYCNICDFVCTLASELIKHIRLVHEDGKPYQCQECGHRVKGPALLEVHIRRNHTYEKPFICEICGKSFFQNNNLQMHMRVHTGEKPFECTLCPYKFPHRKDLRRHMMTHTKEKPHACHLCDYRVARKEKLVKHLLKQHNSAPSPVKNSYSIAQNNLLASSTNFFSEGILQS